MSGFANASAPPIYSALPQKTCQNDENLKEYLTQKGWPEAMQNVFIKNIDQVPLRYFICDDSGSMSLEDGQISVDYNGKCT
jgi:hypothetical protein